MSSNTIIVTGASGGAAANRREINDFVKDEKQFSLYIQALTDIMSRPQPEFISFFQVGAIHGLPYTVWDGATGPSGAPPAGYCTHGSTLFPTWHRPYVALYEQLLHESAQRFASQYTSDQDSWMAAAATLRQPFWDWAKTAVPPPEVISMDQVTITTPKGRGPVNNPLRRYTFNPIDPSFPQPYKQWQTTLRHPNLLAGPDATDDVPSMKSILENAQRDITTKTYALLTRVHDWPPFSNHTVKDGGSSTSSLEAIHDGIHLNVGGPGHMGDIAVAGFDPIFFLHHANVDRLVSLWSAINPGVWVTPGPQGDPTLTLPSGSPVDVNTPLTPFWNTNTTFWLSSAVTQTTPLAYTYPEFNGLDLSNPGAVRIAIAEQVNRLYGDAVFGGYPSPFQSLVKEPVPAVPAAPEAVISGSTSDLSVREWSARVQFKTQELGTSFTVSIFLGAVPDDSKDWRTASTFVGAHHALVNSAPEGCANCQRRVNEVNEGFVHLNGTIAKHAGLGSFEPDVVKPYLAKELHWRIQRSDGTPAELESLEVVIVATTLTWPRGVPLPIVGDTTHHHDVTRGRRGGSRN